MDSISTDFPSHSDVGWLVVGGSIGIYHNWEDTMNGVGGISSDSCVPFSNETDL